MLVPLLLGMPALNQQLISSANLSVKIYMWIPLRLLGRSTVRLGQSINPYLQFNFNKALVLPFAYWQASCFAASSTIPKPLNRHHGSDSDIHPALVRKYHFDARLEVCTKLCGKPPWRRNRGGCNLHGLYGVHETAERMCRHTALPCNTMGEGLWPPCSEYAMDR